jgi:DNA-binding winged helix-turn-helix (wHTH) protein
MALGKITSKPPVNYQDLHLKVEFSRRRVTLDSTPLALTPKEYELLSLLVDNADAIVPRQVLLKRVWGYSDEIRTHTLEVHIYRLRKLLGSYSSQYIAAIFRKGYRFQPITQERCRRLGRLSTLAGRMNIVGSDQSASLARGGIAAMGGKSY